MTLEQQFRNGLAGQLSDEKTDVDIRVAVKIAREFAGKFAEWSDEKSTLLSTGEWYNFLPNSINDLTTEELLKIFEDEVYGK